MELRSELDSLKSILQAPFEYLRAYFTQLRNRIDEQFVEKQRLYEINYTQEDSHAKKELNKSWNEIIEKVISYEKECIFNCKTYFKKNEPQFALNIQLIEVKLNSLPSKIDSDLYRETLYLIRKERDKLKKFLFNNKTILFLKDDSSTLTHSTLLKSHHIGKLIFIRNCYFSHLLIEQFLNNNIDYSDRLTNNLIKLELLNRTKLLLTHLNEVDIVYDLKEIKLDNRNILLIEQDVFQDMSKLIQIDLSSNRLTKIPNRTFTGLHSLKLLNLSQNRLESIEPGTFNGLVSLQDLNLSCNELNILDSSVFNSLSSLRRLDLSFNELTHLDSLTFNQLNNLKELYLNDNKLVALNLKLFIGLNNLSKLWLQNNMMVMSAIDPNVFGDLNLHILRLDDSEMVFDVSVNKVGKFKTNNKKVNDANEDNDEIKKKIKNKFTKNSCILH